MKLGIGTDTMLDTVRGTKKEERLDITLGTMLDTLMGIKTGMEIA